MQVVTKIAGIYAERLMSDVLLVVGDQSLPAHRLILCASSEVFQVGHSFILPSDQLDQSCEAGASPPFRVLFIFKKEHFFIKN